MNGTPAAFPLAWPPGFPRAKFHKEGTFSRHGKRITLEQARLRLSDELELLGAQYVVLSSNVPMRLDGRPGSDLSGISDTGVCCYFQLSGRPVSLPCDRYYRVPDNVAAIAAHVSATRAIERHGVGTLEKLFAGFMALPPPPDAPPPWWKILGLPESTTDIEYVEYRYRKLIAEAHPDRGGSHDRAAALTAAMAEARRSLA